MVFRIASIVLHLCGVLVLILGLLFWSGNTLMSERKELFP